MTKDLSAQIAHSIRESIIDGELIIGARLPSEAELAEKYDVARSTIREALKRLAAQNLIRTQRGATGGAFVNRLTFEDAHAHQVTTSTLLLSMNEIDITTACEARYAMERACAPLSSERREKRHMDLMRAELSRQSEDGLSDEAFCASDVAFHRAFVDAAQNPVLSFQLAGAVEAMQPLMNMITFSARSRGKIISLHSNLLEAIEARSVERAQEVLTGLQDYTLQLATAQVVKRK